MPLVLSSRACFEHQTAEAITPAVFSGAVQPTFEREARNPRKCLRKSGTCAVRLCCPSAWSMRWICSVWSEWRPAEKTAPGMLASLEGSRSRVSEDLLALGVVGSSFDKSGILEEVSFEYCHGS
jgi:hypothetical protein